MNIQEVVRRLKAFASLSLAESWDNVGLLIEPPHLQNISSILLTNDLTEDVMDEAEQKKVNMVLSYHPPIFRPLKSITLRTWKERIVGRCLAGGIAVYSPHTCYDAVKGGVNDWLIQPFAPGDVLPIHPSSSESYSHLVHVRSSDSGESFDEVKRKLGEKIDLSGRFYVAPDGTTATLFCYEKDLFFVAAVLSVKSGYSMNVTKLEKVPMLDEGMGRSVQLHSSLPLSECINKVKTHLGLKHVRLAFGRGSNLDTRVRSVAVCAGSGVSVLRGAKADLMVTGEMTHHEVLDLVHRGVSVILVDHSNSERGFLRGLKPKLWDLLDNKVAVEISGADKDPLEVM